MTNFDKNGENGMLHLLGHVVPALLIFFVNSVVLILFFSFLMGHTSKLTIYADACKIALPGTTLSFIFTLLNPFLPRFFSFGPLSAPIDIGISVALVMWVILVRRYLETSLLSAIIIAVMAVIIYLILMFFAVSLYHFLLLLMESMSL